MLYLFPHKVKMEKARDEKIAFSGERLQKNPSGVYGSPSLATREKGRLLFQRIVLHLERALDVS